ncbi:unnamed protein product [Clonostachys rosea f. rosea IK726]|jgi:hypothetical protein|uniref:Cupin type-2 domain-containing protein n=2 Tax=Bionectria ochroleuca TaxID=29856 RepID=A0A0B7KCD3_BIOOC|nr:unnamed protein product [Clonostachys rosea f. rosea IK726]
MALSHSQAAFNLPTPNRFITDHNSNGLAVFDTSVPEVLPTEAAGPMANHFAYATETFPADFTNKSDLAAYSSMLSAPPGIFIATGSVLRIVDMQPGGETPLHQTDSLDYGVVLEGEVELELDSGETRTLKRGDVSVQRATNHLWRNLKKTESSRMLFVSLGAKPDGALEKS